MDQAKMDSLQAKIDKIEAIRDGLPPGTEAWTAAQNGVTELEKQKTLLLQQGETPISSRFD